MPELDPAAREALLQMVDKQLRDADPPETTETLQRLVTDGYSDEDAKNLLAAVVQYELTDMWKDRRLFDRERFVAALADLPELPPDPD